MSLERTTLKQIRVNYPWLINSEIYRELVSDNQIEGEENEVFSAPICHINSTIENILNIMDYWKVEIIPLEVLDNINQNKDKVKTHLESLTDFKIRFEKILDFINAIDTCNYLTIVKKGYSDIFFFFSEKVQKFDISCLIHSKNDEISEYLYQNPDKLIANDESFNLALEFSGEERLFNLLIGMNILPNDNPFYSAVKGGKLNSVLWLLNNDYSFEEDEKIDVYHAFNYNFNLDILEKLLKRNLPRDREYFLCNYIMSGNLEMVKYLRRGVFRDGSLFPEYTWDDIYTSREFPYVTDTYMYIAKSGSFEMLKWIHEDGLELTSVSYSNILSNLNLKKVIYTSEDSWQGEIDFESTTDDTVKMFKYLLDNHVELSANAFAEALKLKNFRFLEYLVELRCPLDGRIFERAVGYKRIDLLEYLLSIECPHDWRTFNHAVQIENFEILNWLKEHNFKVDKESIIESIGLQNLDILNFLYEYTKNKEIFQSSLEFIASVGNIEIMMWAIEKLKLEELPESLTSYSVEHQQLDMLNLLKDLGVKLDDKLCEKAAFFGNIQILEWLVQNGCKMSKRVTLNAFLNNHYRLLKWAVENGAPLHSYLKGKSKFGHKNKNKDMLNYIDSL